MRVFVALNIPERTKDNLARSAQQIEQFTTNGAFVPKQNYHVTLHFLGEVAPSDLIYVQSAMDGVKDMPAPRMAVNQFCVMKSSNVVCANFNNNKALLALHDQLGEGLEKAGFTVEHRAYRPHVTIARKPKFSMPFSEVSKNVDVFNMPFDATQVVLYQSTLEPSGAVYTPLYTVDLKPQQ